MSLIIERASLFLSVQDLGRVGYARFGLPESGPMDWWAQRAANRLVGNMPDAACLEIGLTDTVFRLDEDALLAVCGAGYQVRINGRPIPLWMAFLGRCGDRVTVEKVPGGNLAYLSAAGGLHTPEWLGSRSVTPRAGLGQYLGEGDMIHLRPEQPLRVNLAGGNLPEKHRPAYRDKPLLRAVPGPHLDRFTPQSLDRFWGSEFGLTNRSDRMGYRLHGEPLAHVDGADLVSQGMVLGEVQVPGDGQPIIMMPDHPTTGGYTCVATVARCDLPLLAQAPMGTGRIRFTAIEPAAALQLLRNAVNGVDAGIEFPEEEWLEW
jgi:biotin-dependent carboxylase-like uncharacterized protein